MLLSVTGDRHIFRTDVHIVAQMSILRRIAPERGHHEDRRMAPDDLWRDRLTLVVAGFIAIACVGASLVQDYLGHPANAYVITAGTVSLTVLAGYGKAGFSTGRGRRPLDHPTPTRNGDSPSDGVVVAKKGAVP